MNEEKMNYLRKELRKVWDNQDFVQGILNDFDYDSELDEMIEFVDKNKGMNTDPSDYVRASMNVMFGEGNWENGQLIELVEDSEEDV